MKEFTIITKYIDRPHIDIKGILVYLADVGYNENNIDNEKHRTGGLIWMGYPEKLKEEIVKIKGNYRGVIQTEVNEFRENYDKQIQDLYRVARYGQVKLMVQTVEEFIYATIENIVTTTD